LLTINKVFKTVNLSLSEQCLLILALLGLDFSFEPEILWHRNQLVRDLFLLTVSGKFDIPKEHWLLLFSIIDGLLSILELENNFLAFVQIFGVGSVDTSKAVSKASLVIVIDSGIDHILIWDVDISGCFFEIH